MKKPISSLVAILIVVCCGSSFAYTPDANAPRSSVPAEYKWDLSAIYASDGAWESAYNDVNKRLAAFSKYKGRISDPATLAECLTEYFAIREILGKVTMYSGLRAVEDQEVAKYEKMDQRAVNLSKELNEKTSFVRREVLSLGDDQLALIMAYDAIEPYRGYIEDMTRRKSRLLGAEAEDVMGLAGDILLADVANNEIPSDVETIYKGVMRDLQLPTIKDEDGKDVQLTLSNYSKYRASKDRAVRKAAVEGFLGALKKYQNSLAASLGGEFKRDIFMAKVRKYDSSLGAFLDKENVPPAVVRNLIDTVDRNLKPLHDYMAVRKKLLGLKELRLYDTYVSIVPEMDVDVPYAKAIEYVNGALKPLGDEYLGVVSKAIEPGSGWVDVYPNKGKESGAFSSSTCGVHPYVKMNYQNKIDDVSTLAHEFGHSMHSYLNMQVQPCPTFGYSTFTAEIASTFNENLLSDYLLNQYKDDEKMQLYLLGERAEMIRGTVYVQTMFAEFETKMHDYAEEGVPMTADLFNKTFKDLIVKYFGPAYKYTEGDEIVWGYIPHFYWKFYVFSYATGLSSGIALSEAVLKDGEPARARYFDMLRQPNIAPPVEILKVAGVDLSKPDAIKAAAELMAKTVRQINALIK